MRLALLLGVSVDHPRPLARFGRRSAVAGLAAALLPWQRQKLLANPIDSNAAVASQWQVFRSRYLSPDGRVIDTGNGGISHSEGQGWGMLFAQAANDKDSFDLIFAWTSTYLARPNDALHVWRYDPSAKNPTADMNNATDGDIFIAWALARGAQSWGQPALSSAATAIAADIRDKLCFAQSGQVFLLPGISGFVLPGALTLNPSYYVWPAFETLAQLAPSSVWASLRADGLSTLTAGVFGKYALPPDWLEVSRPGLSLQPAAPWPPRFSFDAIRVPLWLSWAKVMPDSLGTAFSQYWQSAAFPYRPAWVNLQDGSFAKYAAPSGMAAITNFTLAVLAGTQPSLPNVADATDYYSAALTMLSYLAVSELSAN
jgi:endoglucanase